MGPALLRILPVLAAIGALGAWVWVAASRAAYPYELEWMEGGMLQHVERLRAGEPLFVAPTLEFAPFPYTPLYAWTASTLPDAAALPFLPLRLLSIASALLLFALVGALGAASLPGDATRGVRIRAAILAAGLVAAANEFTGAWLDLARVDSLALALVCAAWLFGARAAQEAGPDEATKGGLPSLFASLLFVSLAVLAKQSFLPMVAALSVPLARRRLWLAPLYVFIAAAFIASGVFALARGSLGEAKLWLFDLLTPMRVHGPAVIGFWTETGVALGPALLVVLLAGAGKRVRFSWPSMLVPALTLVGIAWVSRVHEGGFDNTLLPAVVAVAVLFGSSAAALGRHSRGALGAVLCTGAFVVLLHDPGTFIPTPADRAAGDALVGRIRGLELPVFVPDHGYLTRLAHGDSAAESIHGMAIIDLSHSDPAHADLSAWRESFDADLRRALGEGRFGAVILDDRWDAAIAELRAAYMPPIRLWPEGNDAFLTVSGAPKRPEWLFLRRPR